MQAGRSSVLVTFADTYGGWVFLVKLKLTSLNCKLGSNMLSECEIMKCKYVAQD